MDESSDSHFFRPSTWIWSRPDRCLWRIKVGDDFLTNFGVTEISIEKFQLRNFRLVMDGKACTEIPASSRFEFFEKLPVQNLLLPDEISK